MRAQQLTEPLAGHGEGPVWSDADAALLWLDMLAGRVLALHGSGGVTAHAVADLVSLVRPLRDGGFVATTAHELLTAPHLDGPWRSLGTVEPDPSLRLNEGACDPLGRLWAGTMAWDASPGRGSLRRLDECGEWVVAVPGVTISNGLDWTADGGLAYYADSPTGQVVVWDDVRPETRRAFVSVDPDVGVPDGLCVDAEGNVWVAVWGGSVVHAYSPAGELVEVVELPCSQVTACTFGGPDLDTLFVTTSRHDLPAWPDDAAGALFGVGLGYSAGQATRRARLDTGAEV